MRAAWATLAVAVLGCRSADRPMLRVDPALAAMIPPDAVLVAGVKMDALRQTPSYRTWVQAKAQPWLDQLRDRFGLDPRKDLWEALLASDGKRSVVMVRGKFSPTGLEPRLERPGARRMAYKGYTIVGDERAAVTFMNSSTAVAGSLAAVQAVIDQRNRGGGNRSPLLAKLKTIPAGSQIWLLTSDAGAFASELPASGNAAAVAKIVAMLGPSELFADLRAGLKLTARGVCRTEEDARTLSEGLRGLIGLARLTSPDNRPELLRAYDGIRVEQHQQSVTLAAEIPQDLLDPLIARFSQPGVVKLPGELRRRTPQPKAGK